MYQFQYVRYLIHCLYLDCLRLLLLFSVVGTLRPYDRVGPCEVVTGPCGIVTVTNGLLYKIRVGQYTDFQQIGTFDMA